MSTNIPSVTTCLSSSYSAKDENLPTKPIMSYVRIHIVLSYACCNWSETLAAHKLFSKITTFHSHCLVVMVVVCSFPVRIHISWVKFVVYFSHHPAFDHCLAHNSSPAVLLWDWQLRYQLVTSIQLRGDTPSLLDFHLAVDFFKSTLFKMLLSIATNL